MPDDPLATAAEVASPASSIATRSSAADHAARTLAKPSSRNRWGASRDSAISAWIVSSRRSRAKSKIHTAQPVRSRIRAICARQRSRWSCVGKWCRAQTVEIRSTRWRRSTDSSVKQPAPGLEHRLGQVGSDRAHIGPRPRQMREQLRRARAEVEHNAFLGQQAAHCLGVHPVDRQLIDGVRRVEGGDRALVVHHHRLRNAGRSARIIRSRKTCFASRASARAKLTGRRYHSTPSSPARKGALAPVGAALATRSPGITLEVADAQQTARRVILTAVAARTPAQA